MKAWQSSTMPRYRKISSISIEQYRIFDQVVSLLYAYAERLDNRKTTPEHYELWTSHNYRSISMNPKNKRGILFVGAMITKKHIGLYFYPLHINPALTAKIDEAIRPFWKGNSTFHFKTSLSELTQAKLAQLIAEGWQYYLENKWAF